MNLKPGDIFYSVMQKDNSPFEKPRICKFIVKSIKPERKWLPHMVVLDYCKTRRKIFNRFYKTR